LDVQGLPSLHGVLSDAFGLLHWPVCGSRVPARWHWSCAAQVTFLQRSTQAPFLQTSFVGHWLSTLQVQVPFWH
jgi:hypothetical protein